MGTLEGEVALVPGSGRGIGRKITFRLASTGAKVVVTDLGEDRLHEAIPPIEIVNNAGYTWDNFGHKMTGGQLKASVTGMLRELS